MRQHNRPLWAATPPLVSLELMSSACLSRARPLLCNASSSLGFSRPWYLAICWSSSCFSYRKTEILAPGGQLTSAVVGDVTETPTAAACLGYTHKLITFQLKYTFYLFKSSACKVGLLLAHKRNPAANHKNNAKLNWILETTDYSTNCCVTPS